MATLTVLKFNNPKGAEQVLEKLQILQNDGFIKIEDAAMVSWPVGRKKPKTRQLVDLVGKSALKNAFWGLLFGIIFVVPILGMAIGAAVGAMAGKMDDYGISDEFIEETRAQVTEGTSALFLLTSGAVQDKVVEELKGKQFELIASNLNKVQEEQLMAAFSAE